MNIRDKKGSITIFVLVGLLFMTSFLLISLGSNVNKSKIAKEQFNIISSIYSHGDGDANAYKRAYTAIRRRNAQILTDYSENSSTLELTKTFEDKLIDYKIYGNSVQNGTPSPTNPVEVESVGNLKANLFNLEGREVKGFWEGSSEALRTFTGNGIYIGVHQANFYNPSTIDKYTLDEESNKVVFNPNTNYGIGFDFKVEPNTAYTFKTGSENNYVAITEYTENGEYILNSILQESVTITTTSETKWILAILTISANQQTGIEYTFSEIQLEQASIPTEYDKLGKYEIPIRVSSLNLFNFDNIKNTGSSTGIVNYTNKTLTLPSTSNMYLIGESFSGAPTAFERFNSVLNITDAGYYCLKAKVNSNVVNIEPRAAWVLNVTGGEATQPTVITSTFENGYYFIKYQFTDEIIEKLKTANTFRIYLYAFRTTDTKENVDVTISDIMFVKGDYTIDNMPEYQANIGEIVTEHLYIDQPLRKVGEVADYIDFSTGKVVRKIKEVEVNGEHWGIYHNNQQPDGSWYYYGFRTTVDIFDVVLGREKGLSNMSPYVGQYYSQKNAMWLGVSSKGIYWIKNDYYDASLEDYGLNNLKERLNSYPLKIYYESQVELPQENIELPEFNTYEDYTKIEVLTDVVPSKIEATYYGYTME